MVTNKIKQVKAVKGDVFKLAHHLRTDDINEIEAKGKTPLQALEQAFVSSYECMKLVKNNQIIGMYGISKHGIIWFLGTDEMENNPFYFVREGKKVINKWLKTHKTLWNIVDSRNRTHIKWLEVIGAKFNKHRYLIINGVRFYPFSITRERE